MVILSITISQTIALYLIVLLTQSNNTFSILPIAEIFKGVSLNENEVKLIESKFELIQCKKGDFLLKEGTVADRQYYVSSGCLRSFFTDAKNKEHTIQFAIKDWWISDYTAYFTEDKAILNIECVEDATVFMISRKDQVFIYDEIPQIERFFRNKMERFFGWFHKRIIGDLAKSATQRYVEFVQTYPNIEQKVKNYHIASYLGITTESLSRIRKEIAKQ